MNRLEEAKAISDNNIETMERCEIVISNDLTQHGILNALIAIAEQLEKQNKQQLEGMNLIVEAIWQSTNKMRGRVN